MTLLDDLIGQPEPEPRTPATCDGHAPHHFERMADCNWCGHPEDEHEPDGFWLDSRYSRRAEPVA